MLPLLFLQVLVFFFFFQAEDGIRDRNVTGVQTCALPISARGQPREQGRRQQRRRESGESRVLRSSRKHCNASSFRSEERRVGKECRSRGAPYHETKRDVTDAM